MKASIKGLLIDFDGTLVESLPSLFKAYNSFLAKHGFTGTNEEFQSLIGPSLKEIVNVLKTRYNLPHSSEAHLEEYKELIKEVNGELLPGVVTFLRYAQAEGIKLAVVTSAPGKWSRKILEYHGIAKYFSFILSGEEVLRGKPDPEIYLEGIKRIALPVEELIAVEDSPRGQQSALSAGLTTLFPDWKAILAKVFESRHPYIYKGRSIEIKLVARPELSSQDKEKVEIEWKKKCIDNPALFNGKIFAFSHLEQSTLYAFEIDYKTYLCRGHISEKLIPLSVSGLTCYENKLLWGKRALFLSQHPGAWELLPSGGLSELDPLKQIMIELKEESNIESSQISSSAFEGVIFNKEEESIEILYSLKLKDPSASSTEEATDLLWKDPNEFPSDPIVPLSFYLSSI